jgi:hypothetical protein
VELFVGVDAGKWKKKCGRKGGHLDEKWLKGPKCAHECVYFFQSARAHADRFKANVRIEATARQVEGQSAQISFLKFADNYARFR